MNVNSVSFKSGFIYNKGTYINPDAIQRITAYGKDKDKTNVLYTNEAKEIFDVPVDTFVAAAIQAKNTDDIVDISKS